MKRSISLYKDVTAPWICAAVYLWALELRAVIGTDSEPITAWFADCAAILLTLVFWVCIASLPIVMIIALAGSAKGISINRFLARAMIVATTAMHFVRWLLNWQFLGNRYDWGLIFLVVTAGILLIFALIRRGRKINQSQTALPTLEDCFSFGALPVLVIAVIFIGFSIARERALTPPQSAALATDSISEKDRAGLPNIVLVVSDALRAQSMSLYGRARTTTP